MRDLHRIRGTDQRQMRDARAQVSGSLQANQRAETVTSQGCLFNVQRIQQTFDKGCAFLHCGRWRACAFAVTGQVNS